MKAADWDDFPDICLELIDEVQATGKPIDITGNGQPELRLMPVDDAIRALFAAEHSH